ncbi:MAG: hypothetical protein IPK33_25785 [Gemmatimonadetes bacterium]|nr:hypothetical protein [Gemmatimonadota bacterium]
MGDGSFSIDQQRYNADLGQLFYEIKGGKIAACSGTCPTRCAPPTLECDGHDRRKKSYEVWGSFFDGKGQPGQVNAVSHGSVPARFRNVNVINTGRKA